MGQAAAAACGSEASLPSLDEPPTWAAGGPSSSSCCCCPDRVVLTGPPLEAQCHAAQALPSKYEPYDCEGAADSILQVDWAMLKTAMLTSSRDGEVLRTPKAAELSRRSDGDGSTGGTGAGGDAAVGKLFKDSAAGGAEVRSSRPATDQVCGLSPAESGSSLVGPVSSWPVPDGNEGSRGQDEADKLGKLHEDEQMMSEGFMAHSPEMEDRAPSATSPSHALAGSPSLAGARLLAAMSPPLPSGVADTVARQAEAEKNTGGLSLAVTPCAAAGGGQEDVAAEGAEVVPIEAVAAVAAAPLAEAAVAPVPLAEDAAPEGRGEINEEDAKALAAFLSRNGFTGPREPRRRRLRTRTTFPLHTAVEEGDVNMVRLLLLAGADPSCRNSFGQTAEDLVNQRCVDVATGAASAGSRRLCGLGTGCSGRRGAPSSPTASLDLGHPAADSSGDVADGGGATAPVDDEVLLSILAVATAARGGGGGSSRSERLQALPRKL
mmetsp:Transcript_104248/g.262315  ORF Transcript_104248/g.262315 Transcript_104248/m.262315 type:complete len:492 (+) Transcript_104248:74-1549(+)